MSHFQLPLLIVPPLERADAVLLEAVRQRDGSDQTLQSASRNSGFTLADLFGSGDGAPPNSGIFVARLGRLVYRLFVALDFSSPEGAPRDTITKSVFVWDVAAPYGAAYNSYLAVRRGNEAPVLLPFPEVPEVLRERPSTVEETQTLLRQLVRAITDTANVGLLAGRMLHPADPDA